MIVKLYNGEPVDTYTALLPVEAQRSIMFWNNKLSSIIDYYKNELEACDGRIIIACRYTGKQFITDIDYQNIPTELEHQIRSRLV